MKEEAPTLFGELTVYREQGNYLRRLEQFSKAKEAFDKALKNAPDEVGCLTGRSRVCSNSMQPMQAYKDAFLALTLEPRNIYALNMKGRALYNMTEFEQSLIVNVHGVRRRKQPPYFLEGKNTGIQTIENCLGPRAGNVMINFLPLIKKQEARSDVMEKPLISIHKCRIPQAEAKYAETLMEIRKHARLSRVLAMKYLGSMAYDKFFLENLKVDRRLISANANGSAQLKSLVKETLSALNTQQEMLRTQCPYYTFQAAKKAHSQRQQKFEQSIIESERKISALTVEKSLKHIDTCLREHRIKDLISVSERLQVFMDSKSNTILPERDVYLDRLYRAVGEAYLSQHRLTYSKSEKGNRRRIAFLMGLPVGRAASHDSVVANFPHKYVNLKSAAEKIINTLKFCEHATMRCWLLYELARLLLMRKNYALSKHYAKQCQRESFQINNVVWWMNSCFILLSNDMQQDNGNEVRAQVEEALVYSKNLQDSERVQAFLMKCADMANELTVADDKKVTATREQEILSILDEKQRVETQLLFKRMAGIPPRRRMAVIQGKFPAAGSATERRKRKQKGLTIIPGKTKSLPPFPKSGIPGYQIF